MNFRSKRLICNISLLSLLVISFSPENSYTPQKISTSRISKSSNSNKGFIDTSKNSSISRSLIGGYCRVTSNFEIPGLGLLFDLDFPSTNFQWNPVIPFLDVNEDATISSVNVDTWFHYDPIPEKHMGFDHIVTGIFNIVIIEYWSPYPYMLWSFGDGSPLKFSTIYLPESHLYEFSSYFQEARAVNNDPGFPVYAISFWRVEVFWFGNCGSSPCGGSFTIPELPVCKKKVVPVQQVISILVPSEGYPPWLR